MLTNEEELGEAAPSRALPQRAAAVSSPAGKRRRLTGALQAHAAHQAEQAGPSRAADAQAAQQAATEAAAAEQAAAAAAGWQAQSAAATGEAATAEQADAAGPSTAAARVRRSGRLAPTASQQAADEEAVAGILNEMAAQVQLVPDAAVAQEEAEAGTSAAALLGKGQHMSYSAGL